MIDKKIIDFLDDFENLKMPLDANIRGFINYNLCDYNFLRRKIKVYCIDYIAESFTCNDLYVELKVELKDIIDILNFMIKYNL